MSRRQTTRKPPGDPGDLRMWPDGSVEVDLFGEVDAELARRAENDRRVTEFERRVHTMPDGTPVLWVAPHSTPTASRGEAVPGWRCWLCGQVEGNAYALQLAHGLHPGDPLCLTRATCTAQDRALRHGTTATAETGDSR